jgi:hypothetical protein
VAARAAQRIDHVVYRVGALGVVSLEILKPGGDLASQVDVPIAHAGTIANPIVMKASMVDRAGWGLLEGSRFT